MMCIIDTATCVGYVKKRWILAYLAVIFVIQSIQNQTKSLYVIKVILIVVKSNTTSPNETPCIVSIHLVLVLIECYPLCVD